jgi:hypothetical protein
VERAARYDAVPGGEHGKSSASQLVRRVSNYESQVWLFNDVFNRLTLLRVTTCSDIDRWVGRQVGNVFAKPDRMRPNAGRAIVVRHGWPVVNIRWVRRNGMGGRKLGATIVNIRVV